MEDFNSVLTAPDDPDVEIGEDTRRQNPPLNATSSKRRPTHPLQIQHRTSPNDAHFNEAFPESTLSLSVTLGDDYIVCLEDLLKIAVGGVIVFNLAQPASPKNTEKVDFFQHWLRPLRSSGFSLYCLAQSAPESTQASLQRLGHLLKVLKDPDAKLIEALGFMARDRKTIYDGSVIIGKDARTIGWFLGSLEYTMQAIWSLVQHIQASEGNPVQERSNPFEDVLLQEPARAWTSPSPTRSHSRRARRDSWYGIGSSRSPEEGSRGQSPPKSKSVWSPTRYLMSSPKSERSSASQQSYFDLATQPDPGSAAHEVSSSVTATNSSQDSKSAAQVPLQESPKRKGRSSRGFPRFRPL